MLMIHFKLRLILFHLAVFVIDSYHRDVGLGQTHPGQVVCY